MSTMQEVMAMMSGTGARAKVTYRDHMITILMGTWLMIGLFVDGWAHNNLGAELETFFTPWHAVFYSGFLATAGWMVWLVARSMRAGLTGAAAVPRGYGLGLVGLVLFGLGGFGDMIWHIIFGIEQNIEALLSPTHLLIFLGGALILASPARALWAADNEGEESFRAMFPAILSVTLTGSFIAFMNQYLWAFYKTYPFQRVASFYANFSGRPGMDVKFMGEALGLACILLTTIFVMAPVLMMFRRWRLPVGTTTFLFTVMAVLMSSMMMFSRPQMAILPLIAAGLVGDALLAALRPGPDSVGAVRTFAVVVPLVLWTLFLIAGHIAWGLLWSIELYAGAAVMAALTSLGLSLLVNPAPAPAR